MHVKKRGRIEMVFYFVEIIGGESNAYYCFQVAKVLIFPAGLPSLVTIGTVTAPSVVLPMQWHSQELDTSSVPVFESLIVNSTNIEDFYADVGRVLCGQDRLLSAYYESDNPEVDFSEAVGIFANFLWLYAPHAEPLASEKLPDDTWGPASPSVTFTSEAISDDYEAALVKEWPALVQLCCIKAKRYGTINALIQNNGIIENDRDVQCTEALSSSL